MRDAWGKFGLLLRLSPLSVLLVVGCTQINPAKPPDIAPPAFPAAQVSTVTIPVNVDVSAIGTEIQNALGGGNNFYFVTGQDIGNGVTLQMGLKLNGSVGVSANNGCLDASIPIAITSGRVDKNFGFPVGSHHADIGGSANFTMRACLGLTNDWKISSSINSNFSFTSNPTITYHLPSPLPAITIDIASRVSPVVQGKLGVINAAIEQRLSAVSVRPIVERGWTSVQKPITAWASPVVTLDIVPISAGLGAPTSTGNTITLKPAVSGRVTARLGTSSAPKPVIPLPGNSGNVGPDSIVIQVQAVAPFVDLNSLLSERVAGHTYSLGDGKSITVGSAEMFGYGSSVGVKVDFRARTSFWPFNNVYGTLYIAGKPSYQDAARRIFVQDLQFDANTSSLLIDAAALIAHSVLLDELGRALTFDISPYVNPLLDKIHDGLHNYKIQDGVTANLQVTSFTNSDFLVSKEGIAILFSATGSGNIQVDKLSAPAPLTN